MTKKGEMSINEKKLLNLIGKNACLSYKEILSLTEYKRIDTICKKIKKMRELNILRGQYYDIYLSGVGTNQVYNIYADIMYTPEDQDLIFTLLKTIKGIRWIFPAQQGSRLFAQFQCSHYSVIGRLLTFLKEKKLIEYWMTASRNRWIKVNPDFFGPPIPDTKNLFDAGKLPDLSYAPVKSKKRWNRKDLIFMQYLQVKTEKVSKIREIEFRKYKRFWKYDQVRQSIRKIKESGILQYKDFHISPYPREKCCTFILILNAPRKKSLLTLLHNFGGGCRIHRSYTLAGEVGLLFCWANPEIMTEIIAIFDAIDSITLREIYYLRTHTGKYLYAVSFEPDLFDVRSQKWVFPYLREKRKIEELIEDGRGK
ncbi:MAG: hypothetical protein HXS54_09085 [Theionarchaea archaeon]|nr:hypothetical protein [Theionarchaea archaeon]